MTVLASASLWMISIAFNFAYGYSSTCELRYIASQNVTSFDSEFSNPSLWNSVFANLKVDKKLDNISLANPDNRSIIVLCLILSGQVELNPGLRTIKYPCTLCNKAVKNYQPAIQCDECNLWTHTQCLNFRNSTYEYLQINSFYWFCSAGGLPNYTRSLSLDLSDFLDENSFNLLNGTQGIPTPGSSQHMSTPKTAKSSNSRSRTFTSLSLNCNSLKSSGKTAELNALINQHNS